MENESSSPQSIQLEFAIENNKPKEKCSFHKASKRKEKSKRKSPSPEFEEPKKKRKCNEEEPSLYTLLPRITRRNAEELPSSGSLHKQFQAIQLNAKKMVS